MSAKKRTPSPKSVDSFRHQDEKRVNIPPAEMQGLLSAAEREALQVFRV